MWLCTMAIATFGIAWHIGDTDVIYIAGGMGLLAVLLATAVHHLTVENQGEVLAIRFGPMPLFRRTVRYAEIESVEVSRTSLLQGQGIHWSIRGGWVWNLWGHDCVAVRFNKGGVLRIGTDEAWNLADFLERKVGGRGR